MQGVYSYTYGAIQQNYNHWGISARTNTSTDAKGNVVKTTLQLTGGTFGAVNALTFTGLAYAGAAGNSNVSGTQYLPDMTKPSTILAIDQLLHLWQTTLDGNGNLSSLQDPLNHITSFGYSADGTLLTSITDPTNLVWNFHYGENGNPASRLTSVSDPGGTVRFNANYNAFGQQTSVTVPAGASGSGLNETTTTAYDATTGDLTSITDPLGDVVKVNAYDALGDPLSVSAYPDTGNPATSLTPLTTSFAYDAAQMPIQITDASGVSLNTTFTNGVMTAFQQVEQGATLAQITLSRDSRGRVYAASDLAGTLAQYKYDRNSNLTRLIDGRGNTTQLQYGFNNEPTETLWPDSNGIQFYYDAAGRPASRSDERGIVSDTLYDFANRLTDIQFPAYPAQNVHLTYDNANRPLVLTDATGSTTYAYDPVRKRVQSVTTVIAALPAGHNTFVVNYAYNPDGSVANVTTAVGQTAYVYDQAGELINLTSPFGETTNWTVDHAGRPTSETTHPVGGVPIATTYTYGVSGQAGDPSSAPAYLRTLQHNVNGSLFALYTLTHSYLGQVQSRQAAGDNESFGYDSRGRLNTETDSYQPDQNHSYASNNTYSYDLANNVQGGTGGWSYNNNNQVTSAPYEPSAQSLAGGSGLAYDASGNLTAGNGLTLGYDCFGHLASVTGSAYGPLGFTYDALGRRVSKTVNGVSTFFLYDGRHLIAEVDGNGNIVRSYTWGALGLVSTHSGGVSQFFLFDDAGNTRAVLSGSGTVITSGAYTAYGGILGAAYPLTSFGYKGRAGVYFDKESGLFLMSARYYAPSLGRFLSRDPLGFVNGPNVYTYCMGDPVDFLDPSGLYSMLDIGTFIDGLFGNHAASYGNAAGRYDSGKASAWEVVKAAAGFGGELATAASMVKGLGSLAGNLGRKGLQALAARAIASEATESAGEAIAGNDIALSLDQHLQQFADETGAAPYWDWPGFNGTVDEGLWRETFDRASTIHFNLDGIDETLYEEFLNGGGQLSNGNVTNWELKQILENSSWLGKTRFYSGNY